MNESQKSRADLVAEYNHMATALGLKKVKDFKSKAIAEERIRRITPDYKLAVEDLDAPKVGTDESTAQPDGDAVQAAAEVIGDAQAGVFQQREPWPFNTQPGQSAIDNVPQSSQATQDDAPVDNSGKQFKIVMHNNPNTAYWDVTTMLEGAFGLNFDAAQELMYECDNDDKATIRGGLTEGEARELLDKVETKRAEMVEAAEQMDKRTQEHKRAMFIKDLVFTMEEQQ